MPNYEPYGSPATGSTYRPAQLSAGERINQGVPTPGSGASGPAGYSSLQRGPSVAGGMRPSGGGLAAAWHNSVSTPDFRSVVMAQNKRVAAQVRPNAYETATLQRTPEGRATLAQYQAPAQPAAPRMAIASSTARPAVAPPAAPSGGALAALANRNAAGSAALERFNPGANRPAVRSLPRYDEAKLAARAYGSPAKRAAVRVAMQAPKNHVGMQPAGPGLSQYAQATYNYHRAANYGHDIAMAAAMEAEHGLQQQQAQNSLASSTARMQNAQADWANTRMANYNPYADAVMGGVQGGMTPQQAQDLARDLGYRPQVPPAPAPAAGIPTLLGGSGAAPAPQASPGQPSPQVSSRDPGILNNPDWRKLRELVASHSDDPNLDSFAADVNSSYPGAQFPPDVKSALLSEIQGKMGTGPNAEAFREIPRTPGWMSAAPGIFRSMANAAALGGYGSSLFGDPVQDYKNRQNAWKFYGSIGGQVQAPPTSSTLSEAVTGIPQALMRMTRAMGNPG